MKEMKFTYLGQTYDLFGDNIVSEENFMSKEESGSVDIILRHGILEICEFFGFKDHKTEIILCKDTESFGTVVVVQQTMARIGDNGEVESTFVGCGEVNGHNYKNFNVCFPVNVAEKRARSRAVLWELGLSVYGEEEAEAFQDAVKTRKSGGFSSKKSASYKPESDPAPVKAKPVKKDFTPDEKEQAREEFLGLKKYAEQDLGISPVDFMKILKGSECYDLGGDNPITVEHIAADPEKLEVARKMLKDLSEIA